MSPLADLFPWVIFVVLLDHEAHVNLAEVLQAPIAKLLLRHHFFITKLPTSLSLSILSSVILFFLTLLYREYSIVAIICTTMPIGTYFKVLSITLPLMDFTLHTLRLSGIRHTTLTLFKWVFIFRLLPIFWAGWFLRACFFARVFPFNGCLWLLHFYHGLFLLFHLFN